MMMKILIAEDDKITRSMLEHKLIKWGYDAVSTANGEEAWKALQGVDPPKLLLLDWMMPGLEGLEICKRLRQVKTKVPTYVIIVTARVDKKDIVEGLEAGADDYITKPFEDNELQARIHAGQRILELQTALLENEKLQGVLETAGAVCHEINQPLQAISGMTELILLDIKDGHPLFERLTKIKGQIERMGVITQKLMRITRYQAKELMKRKIVDIDKSSDEN